MTGKDTFYPEVLKALGSNGYKVFDVAGKGRSHASKPDYIAMKGSTLIVGEIKSPSEGPLSGSWRIPQNSDTPEFTAVRLDVADRERRGVTAREAGGHEIIIRGQIPDYLRKMGKTYDLPEGIAYGTIAGGYSAPSAESGNIERAFADTGISYRKVDCSQGAVTYIFAIE